MTNTNLDAQLITYIRHKIQHEKKNYKSGTKKKIK